MSFTDYSSLQAAVASWIARDDLTSNIPDFITLFETGANRRLRVRQQELTATLTPSGGVATLPSDYLSWRRVTWTGSSPRELEYVHPTYLHALFPTLAQGDPRYFTIEGSNLTVAPSDNTSLTFDYFQKVASLSNSNTTNWLLTAYPDLYLAGTLTEAYAFMKDPDNMVLWGTRRDGIFDQIDKLDAQTKRPSAIRVMGACP